jgi:iron complex outermembrane receptor protein
VNFIRPFLILLACLVSAISYAQDKDILELTLEELMDIEVTSVAKAPTRLLDTPAAVFVITQEDIRHSGANSIPGLLKMVPGLDVVQLDANRWAVSARGFNGQFANKLLVMIDGRSIYTPIFSGTFWDMQDLVLAEIDRIEVILGPGAALWGANAVNGIINIITMPVEKTLGSKLTAWGGTEQRAGVSAMFGREISDYNSLRITAKASSRDDSQLNGSGADDDSSMGRLGFRWDFNGDRITGRTTGSFYHGREGTNFDRVGIEGDYHDLFNDDTDSTEGSLMTRWSGPLGSDATLSFQMNYSQTVRKEAFYDASVQVLDSEFQVIQPIAQDHTLTLGGNMRFYWDDMTAHFHTNMDPIKDQYNLYSFFIQDEYSLRPDLTLTLGGKFEHNDFTGWEFQPSTRLLWKASPSLSLWGAVSRAVRTPCRMDANGEIVLALYPPGHSLNPTPNDIIPFPIPVMVTFRGDESFESEELTAIEWGAKTLISDRANLSLSFFYNQYRNLRTGNNLAPSIIFSNGLPAGIDQINLVNNDLEGDTYGMEALLEFQATKDWKLIAGYSYINMDFEFYGELEEFINSFYSTHKFSLQSRFKWSETVRFNTWLTYTHDIDVQDQSGIFDLTLSLSWQPSPDWKIEIVGHNLLHDDRQQGLSEIISMVSTQIQRGGFIRLTYEF